MYSLPHWRACEKRVSSFAFPSYLPSMRPLNLMEISAFAETSLPHWNPCLRENGRCLCSQFKQYNVKTDSWAFDSSFATTSSRSRAQLSLSAEFAHLRSTGGPSSSAKSPRYLWGFVESRLGHSKHSWTLLYVNIWYHREKGARLSQRPIQPLCLRTMFPCKLFGQSLVLISVARNLNHELPVLQSVFRRAFHNNCYPRDLCSCWFANWAKLQEREIVVLRTACSWYVGKPFFYVCPRASLRAVVPRRLIHSELEIFAIITIHFTLSQTR